MRLGGLIAALALAFGVLPLTAQEMQWLGEEHDEGAVLYYGLPESDASVIAFHCEYESGEIGVSFDHEPLGAEEGVQADITFSVLGMRSPQLVVRATGYRIELDDKFVLQGSTRKLIDLRRLLTAEGTLSIAVEDGSEEIPLAGAREPALALLKACGAGPR